MTNDRMSVLKAWHATILLMDVEWNTACAIDLLRESLECDWLVILPILGQLAA